MREEFERAVARVEASLRGDEVFRASFSGERSDFVRFNRGAVRQAGSVVQGYLEVDLIRGRRHAAQTVTLSGDEAEDGVRLEAAVAGLREVLEHLPEDPYLLMPTEPVSGESERPGAVPSGAEAIDGTRDAAAGRDLVGVYAGGETFAGFASSTGQRNWHATRSFHLDWSFWRDAERAVKGSYAGFDWDPAELARRAEAAAGPLAALGREPRSPEPGRYRAYLAPAALDELLELLAWGGFGLRAHRTRTSPLARLADGDLALHPSIAVSEHTAEGIAPPFQDEGFPRPDRVSLVEGGAFRHHLVSPRSAVEFGGEPNGASPSEAPLSLEVGAGDLPRDEILERIGTGIYVSNLWYLNFSDRPACRTTGMTRFATFWVEGGRLERPLAPMRFDESVYRMLGENLVGLTAERERILDPGSYGARSTRSALLPGALVEDLTLTL